MTQTELKYEEAFKKLEKLVDELEQPELDLDARFKKFKDALVLSRTLTKRLQQTKKKVEILVKSQLGEASLTALDLGDAGDQVDQDEELGDESDTDTPRA